MPIPNADMQRYDVSANITGIREMGGIEGFEKEDAPINAARFLKDVVEKLTAGIEEGNLQPGEKLTIEVENRTSL